MSYEFKELQESDFTKLSQEEYEKEFEEYASSDYSHYFGTLEDINNLRYEEYINDMGESFHVALITNGEEFTLFVG